jgi:thiamine pyrophosphate-dependent acetolactate synthase large subunit-like protein
MKSPYNPNNQFIRIYNFIKKHPDPKSVPNDDTIIYTSTETISDLIIRKIIQYNGSNATLYGLPGGAWDPFNKTLQESITNGAINYINTSTESAAVFMASYYGEINNTTGISICTSGPGTTMAITGVNNSFDEIKGCVAFFGVSSSDFQSLDISIMNTITQACIYIDNTTINPEQLIEDAFYIAKNGTTEFPNSGPVSVFINQSSWLSTYKYNNKPQSYKKIIAPVNTFLNTIFSNINKNSKIIIRVGNRVKNNIITQLAELTNTYKNIYLHLIINTQACINTYDYSNVGIESSIGNQILNNNYSSVSLVMEIGTGVEYSLTTYTDVKPLMTTGGSKIFYAFDQTLPYLPNSSNSTNTIITDVNYFSNEFIKYMNKTNPTNYHHLWPDTQEEQTEYMVNLLTTYSTQTSLTSTHLTTISFTSQILNTIYKLQTYNSSNITKMIIDDNKLYSVDVGLCSFLTNILLYHAKPECIMNFEEFSSIGCSMAALAGRVATNAYDDVICFIGDGALLNVPGYLIDLTNSLAIYSNIRCLFVLVNDKNFSAVSNSELGLFGYTTTISSTNSIQANINLRVLCQALMGNCLRQTLQLENIVDSSSELVDLQNFVTNWYNKATGFTQGGYYFIYYSTEDGIPRIESQV